jgi:hypothetical protein
LANSTHLLSGKIAAFIGESYLVVQWVETNQSNFRIYPSDIRLLPPHGTVLTAYADVHMDVGRYLIG